MSNEKKYDGGPAFPLLITENWKQFASGMSLRDHFAGLAMQGVLNDWTEVVRDIMKDSSTSERIAHLAKRSYDIADEMIKAREQ